MPVFFFLDAEPLALLDFFCLGCGVDEESAGRAGEVSLLESTGIVGSPTSAKGSATGLRLFPFPWGSLDDAGVAFDASTSTSIFASSSSNTSKSSSSSSPAAAFSFSCFSYSWRSNILVVILAGTRDEEEASGTSSCASSAAVFVHFTEEMACLIKRPAAALSIWFGRVGGFSV